jgi:hypothetical protein
MCLISPEVTGDQDEELGMSLDIEDTAGNGWVTEAELCPGDVGSGPKGWVNPI